MTSRVAPNCSRQPACGRCTDDACQHEDPGGSRRDPAPRPSPLAAGPGAAALRPVADPVPARPHGLGAGGQLSDPGWLGPGLLPGDPQLPLLPAVIWQLPAHRRHRQPGGAGHRHARGGGAAPQRRAGQAGAARLRHHDREFQRRAAGVRLHHHPRHQRRPHPAAQVLGLDRRLQPLFGRWAHPHLQLLPDPPRPLAALPGLRCAAG
ncbi:hypothetical protein D3C78_1133100 [compost metagenome]